MTNLYLLSALVWSILLVFPTAHAQEMNNENLEKILYTLSDSLAGSQGQWFFTAAGREMLCLTDENANRMRIITPIIAVEDLEPGQLEACMEANFHSALDVRYALSEGTLWVAYIHPLRELTKRQAIDAVTQVYNAAETFGTTYNSTDLVFPKSQSREEKEELPTKKS